MIVGLWVLAVVVGLASWYSYDLLFRKKAEPPAGPKAVPTLAEPPTLSPEKKEIISKLETHSVVITEAGFAPQTLTIKRYDQVQWENQGSTTHQVKGEGWGNVPIQPGKRFTQAFEETGTFPYSDSLQPTLTGTIIVQ